MVGAYSETDEARTEREEREAREALAKARNLQRLGLHSAESEKDVTLAQKLGQLQPFLAVFAPECMGQLLYFGPT